MKTSGHHNDHGCEICIERGNCECLECGLSKRVVMPVLYAQS
jgi:hypothetical protein